LELRVTLGASSFEGLAVGCPSHQPADMSNREIVIAQIVKLPEDTSLEDFAREIELIAGIRKAREEAVRGEGVSPDQAKTRLDQRCAQWVRM
jgi:hypothetical protein